MCQVTIDDLWNQGPVPPSPATVKARWTRREGWCSRYQRLRQAATRAVQGAANAYHREDPQPAERRPTANELYGAPAPMCSVSANGRPLGDGVPVIVVDTGKVP